MPSSRGSWPLRNPRATLFTISIISRTMSARAFPETPLSIRLNDAPRDLIAGAFSLRGTPDEVLLIFNSLGTPPNSAIHKYMNAKKVPQLFVATGATKRNDPKEFPWTCAVAAYEVQGRYLGAFRRHHQCGCWRLTDTPVCGRT
jgi:hypothetical protein